MKDSGHDPLDERLSALAPDVTPRKDLWPGIARGIAGDTGIGIDAGRRTTRASRHSGLRFAAAAAVVSVCIASAVTWAVVHGRWVDRPAAGPPAAGPKATNLYAVSFDEPHDEAYRAARADIEKTFHERLALLDPATRTKIENSLAVIRQAHADIRQALMAEPDSPVLGQLLESTLHDEFDLYDQVVRTTQPALSRT